VAPTAWSTERAGPRSSVSAGPENVDIELEDQTVRVAVERIEVGPAPVAPVADREAGPRSERAPEAHPPAEDPVVPGATQLQRVRAVVVPAVAGARLQGKGERQ